MKSNKELEVHNSKRLKGEIFFKIILKAFSKKRNLKF